jgi:hypothetical protein
VDFDPISNFGWDDGGKNVNVYLRSGFEGVGAVKETVTCNFLEDSFELKVSHFDLWPFSNST